MPEAACSGRSGRVRRSAKLSTRGDADRGCDPERMRGSTASDISMAAAASHCSFPLCLGFGLVVALWSGVNQGGAAVLLVYR
jgi:hypothetical protein